MIVVLGDPLGINFFTGVFSLDGHWLVRIAWNQICPITPTVAFRRFEGARLFLRCQQGAP